MWPGDIGRHNGTTSAGAGDDDPFRQDIQVLGMQPYWGRMQAVTNGTDFIRYYAPTYLPQEPREPKDAYETRVQRSVLSPYTVRLIDNAAGLILRRPITIDGDDFWQTWSENVDGLGSSLNEFARRALISALTYGHSGILVDFPQDPGVTTLFQERQLGRRPYFNHMDAPDIWGWRQENQLPSSPLTQVRLHEWATVPEGEYGQRRVERIRVIRPDSYEVYQRQADSYGYESGVTTSDAKRIDQAQANSVLSIISMELESALQSSYYFAARYLGIEPPRISLDRDFDFYRLLGQDISVIGQLRAEGALTNETYLKILKSGEIIPDSVNIDDELVAVERLQEEKKAEMEAQLRMQQEAAANRPNNAQNAANS